VKNKFKVGDLVRERLRVRSRSGSMGTTGVVISFEWRKPYDNYEMLLDVHCEDGHVQPYWASELKLVVAS